TADDDGKLLLSYAALSEALSPATRPRSARLDGIVLIGRTQDAESEWEEALPVEMVAALWESMGIPLVPESRAAASRWIAAAVAQLASYRLRAGTGTIACPPPVV